MRKFTNNHVSTALKTNKQTNKKQKPKKNKQKKHLPVSRY